MKRMLIPGLMIFILLSGPMTAYALHGNAPKEDPLTKSIQLKIQHMNELLAIISNRLKENIADEQRAELSVIMKGLSTSMDDIASIIQSGKVSEEELERLNQRLTELRMRINRISPPVK